MDPASLGARLLAPKRDPQLTKLALVDGRRRSRQRIGARGGLGEGDDVANRVDAVRERHDPVEAVGDAAVRRGAVAEGLEQEPEPLVRLLLADSERRED